MDFPVAVTAAVAVLFSSFFLLSQTLQQLQKALFSFFLFLHVNHLQKLSIRKRFHGFTTLRLVTTGFSTHYAKRQTVTVYRRGIFHQNSQKRWPHIPNPKSHTQQPLGLPLRPIPLPPLPTDLIRTARFPRTEYQSHNMIHALAVLDLGEDCWAAVSGSGVSC